MIQNAVLFYCEPFTSQYAIIRKKVQRHKPTSFSFFLIEWPKVKISKNIVDFQFLNTNCLYHFFSCYIPICMLLLTLNAFQYFTIQIGRLYTQFDFHCLNFFLLFLISQKIWMFFQQNKVEKPKSKSFIFYQIILYRFCNHLCIYA